jgi:hypothetical protein
LTLGTDIKLKKALIKMVGDDKSKKESLLDDDIEKLSILQDESPSPGEKALCDDDVHDGSEHSEHSRSHVTESIIEPIPDNAPDTHFRPKSRSSSVRSRALTIVARSRRRGLLGRFALIPEVTRPQEYSRTTKWLITFIVALAAAAAPMGSAIFLRKLFFGENCVEQCQ